MNIKTVLITLLFIPFVSFSQIDYELDIQPILNNNNCTGCHSGPSPSAGIDLTNIESVMASGTVIDGDYENSLLWQVVETGYMPFGSPDLSIEEVNTIAQWISELGGSDLTCDISFTPSSPTASSNTIAIDGSITTDLDIGDEIGVFYVNNEGQYICSSTIIWNGVVNALAGYADDSMTTEIDGFTTNSEMFFFAQTEDGTIHQLSATYNENPPFSALWVNNGFAQILTLNIIDSIECGGVIEDTGCTDPVACNWDSEANQDDGTCLYPEEMYLDCSGNCINDTDQDEVCDEEDNCIEIVNPIQIDSDNDGEGDACDYDDGIGIEEAIDDAQSLIKMIDVLGREQQEHKKGSLLFYIYDNGKVEKKFNP